MEVRVSALDKGLILVEVRGRIVDGPPAEKLQSALRDVVREGKIHTILDFSGVEWFDSTAVEILVAHYVSISKRGGRVVLLNASSRVRKLLEILRLHGCFGWAAELKEAMAWFGSAVDDIGPPYA